MTTQTEVISTKIQARRSAAPKARESIRFGKSDLVVQAIS